MTRQRPFPRFLPLVLLMFVTSALQVFAAPRLSDPCNRIRGDFDAQIKALKQRQKLELSSCRAGGSDQCSSLKAQQKEELRQLNRERDYQLRGCERVPLARGIPLTNTNDCYAARQEYVNNYYDRNPGDHDHYPPPSPGKDGPGKVVSGGNGDGNHPGHRLPRDSGGGAGEPPSYSHRNDSASSSSGHNSGSSHSSGSGHNSGGSSTSASSGHSSSGGGGYSGGSYSGGGGSSSGSSHSSGGSSSSGGGYSGGGSSSGGGSYSGGGSPASSSSAPSHDSGAARPK